jgi:hypothetical protein
MSLNVGAYVLGSLSSSRALVDHAGLLSAYADGVMADKGEVREAYLSHFAFGADLRKHHASRSGSVAGFAGACWSKQIRIEMERQERVDCKARVRRPMFSLSALSRPPGQRRY